MTRKLLALTLAAALLTTGCTKSFSSTGKASNQRSAIDFHARDMVVPDFNSGRTVRCPNVHNTN